MKDEILILTQHKLEDIIHSLSAMRMKTFKKIQAYFSFNAPVARMRFVEYLATNQGAWF